MSSEVTMVTQLRARAYHLKRRVEKRLTLVYRGVLRTLYGLPSTSLDALVPASVEVSAPILDEVGFPPYRGPSDHDDLTPVLRLAAFLECRLVVELGTAYGNLAANLGRVCPRARIITVNAPVESQTGTLVTHRLTREEIGRVYRAYGMESRVEQVFANTLDLDLSRYARSGTVDLAVIDACHDTDYVLNDFLKVAPYIRPGGCVVLHDTHPSMEKHLAGSYVACMLLRRRGYDIRHLAGTWWGVWVKGGSLIPQPTLGSPRRETEQPV